MAITIGLWVRCENNDDGFALPPKIIFQTCSACVRRNVILILATSSSRSIGGSKISQQLEIMDHEKTIDIVLLEGKEEKTCIKHSQGHQHHNNLNHLLPRFPLILIETSSFSVDLFLMIVFLCSLAGSSLNKSIDPTLNCRRH